MAKNSNASDASSAAHVAAGQHGQDQPPSTEPRKAHHPTIPVDVPKLADDQGKRVLAAGADPVGKLPVLTGSREPEVSGVIMRDLPPGTPVLKPPTKRHVDVE